MPGLGTRANASAMAYGALARQAAATRALFAAGYTSSGVSNVIDYVSIETLGNATDFGDLSWGPVSHGACSSSTRGIWAGGYDYVNSPVGNSASIDYVTIATAGNSADFGDLTQARYGVAGLSSSTRGVFGGGGNTTLGNTLSTIDYITIATTGNATSFGSLSLARRYVAGACASPTRGIFAGGFTGAYSNVLDYVTIATTGNATDFGDLTAGRYDYSGIGSSNSTRGLFAGGDTGGGYTNIIDYVTIATTGNATDFGDLHAVIFGKACTSSSTRSVMGGGYTGSYLNVIEYVQIDTTGNSVDFGDLTVSRYGPTACSSGHGGL